MSSLAPVIDDQSRFPMELYGVIYSFLQGKGEDPKGDEDIIQTYKVCKAWQNDPTLQRVRDRAFNHLKDIRFVLNKYPKSIHQLFRSCNLSIIALPILDTSSLRTSLHYTGYNVNFFNPTDMQNSLMRFDDWGEPGFALHLRAIDPQAGQTIDRVLTYILIHDLGWYLSWSHDQGDIQTLIQDHHNQNEHTAPGAICPTCPFPNGEIWARSHFSFLSRVLSNQHPVCNIPNHVVQPIAPASYRNYVITAFAIAALAYIINFTIRS